MGAAVLGVLINRATIPQARVVFSDNVLLTSRNGEPCLILRVGNTRGNFLLNPEIRIGLLTVRLQAALKAILHLEVCREFWSPKATSCRPRRGIVPC
jgi:hypothetical protein